MCNLLAISWQSLGNLLAISWKSLFCPRIRDIEDTFLFSYSFSSDPYYVCWRWKTIQCRIRSSDYLLELRKFNPAQKNRGLLNYNDSNNQLSVRCNSHLLLKMFLFAQNAHDNIICAIVYNGKYLFTSSHSCIKVSLCTWFVILSHNLSRLDVSTIH